MQGSSISRAFVLINLYFCRLPEGKKNEFASAFEPALFDKFPFN